VATRGPGRPGATVLAILRKFPGPDDPDTLEVIRHDADALLAMGRKVAARHQACLALEALHRTLGRTTC
jgi:hypothetical protein